MNFGDRIVTVLMVALFAFLTWSAATSGARHQDTQCRVWYAAARTAADTAIVDVRFPPNHGRGAVGQLSCGGIRRMERPR